MKMVPHQTVGQHPPPIPDSHPAQDLEEPLPIPIIPKHQGTLVPARNNMEDTTSQLDPRRTHHHQNLAPKQTTIEGCGQIVTNPAQDAEETGGWNEEDLTPGPHNDANVGVYASVEQAGPIRRGDPVRLL